MVNKIYLYTIIVFLFIFVNIIIYYNFNFGNYKEIPITKEEIKGKITSIKSPTKGSYIILDNKISIYTNAFNRVQDEIKVNDSICKSINKDYFVLFTFDYYKKEYVKKDSFIYGYLYFKEYPY